MDRAPDRRMKRPLSPLGALARGILAGLVGSLAQSAFFAATKKIAPKPPKDAFRPPEAAQRSEAETEVVARRFVERLMQRGPIVHKAAGGHLVHYAFGSAWGAAYGVTTPSVRRMSTLRGGLAFGTLVWMVSDHLIVPGFRLAGWPQRYPMKNHAYALAAHLVYGAAVAATFAIASGRSPLRAG